MFITVKSDAYAMNTAILLIAHGAHESEGNDSAEKNGARLKEMTGMEVYQGYLHLDPTIDAAAGKMLADGVERIIAVPLFVFPGFLPDNSVRKELGLAPGTAKGVFQKDGKSAEIVFTGTFADHPLIENVLVDICKEYDANPDDTSVMLIFHGSRNAAGSELVDQCVGYLAKRGYEAMASYNEFQSPTVEEATDCLIKKGKNVLAIPVFVSPGGHTTSDIPPKLGVDGSRTRDLGGGKKLNYAKEIGMHNGIADILKARIDELKL